MPKILLTIALIFGINSVLFSQPLTWQKSFNLINGDDEGWAVCAADSSNIYVGGLTSHPGMGSVLKLNRFGEVIWQKTYEDSYYITSMLSAPDGGLVYSANSVLRMLDINGNTVWSVSAPYYNSIFLTSDRFVIAPYYGSYKKYDLNGNLIWDKSISGFPVFSDGLEVNQNNYLLIGSFKHKAYLINIDSSGNLLRSKLFLNNYDAYFSSIEKLNNNIVIFGGYENGSDSTKKFVLKLDQNLDSTYYLNIYTNYQYYKNKVLVNNNKIYLFYNYFNREILKECFIIASYDTNFTFLKKTIFIPSVNWTVFNDCLLYTSNPTAVLYYRRSLLKCRRQRID